MNSLKELFSLAFSKGAGVSLEEILESTEYKFQYEKNSQTLKKFGTPVSTLSMGIALTLRESPVTEIWENKVLSKEKYLELKTLFSLLGEKIIIEAGKRLPQKVLDIAKSISNSKKPIVDLLKAGAFAMAEPFKERSVKDWGERNYSPCNSKVLPCDNNWDGQPNCIGKAQQILAFVRLAGLKPHVIVPITNANYKKTLIHFKEIPERILESFSNLDPESPFFSDYEFWLKKIFGSIDYFEEVEKTKVYKLFHAGILVSVPLSDYIILDPYAGVIGQIKNTQSIKKSLDFLDGHRELFPGMLCMSDDGGFFNSETNKARQSLEKYLNQSHSLRTFFEERKSMSFQNLVKAFVESKNFQELIKTDIPNYHKHTKQNTIKHYILGLCLLLGVDPEILDRQDCDAVLSKKIKLFNTSSRFREERFGLICSMFLKKGRSVFKELHNNPSMTHPLFEIAADADFYMGILVIGHLATNSPTDFMTWSELVSEFAFSQYSLGYAILTNNHGNSRMVKTFLENLFKREEAHPFLTQIN